MLAIHKPDVICLQETRLGVRPDPPQFKHYHSYRRHNGHGIAIYTHKSLPQTEVVLNSALEAVACRVKFGNAYLSICSIYCPPRGPLDIGALNLLFDRLPGRKLLLGDFNSHHYQWGSLRNDARGEQLADFILQTNLCLLNDGRATRVDDGTGNMSCLDLSLSSPDIHNDLSWEPYDDSLGSDHFPICISYSRDDFRPSPPPKFNYKKADWDHYSRVANFDISGDNIDAKISHIQTTIIHAAEAAIPKTTTIPNKHVVSGGPQIADKHSENVIGDTGFLNISLLMKILLHIKLLRLRQEK